MSQSPSHRVLVLVGPTASGKSAVGLELARLLDGEIISADSRQIYKHLTIGTAKPTQEERGTVRHHFVDELEPDQEFTSGQFGERGRQVIDKIFERRKVPIVVGGSGLYIRSLVDGLFDGPTADPSIRASLEHVLTHSGVDALVDKLRRVDPVSADRIDRTKPRRVIRALEVYYLTGTPLSLLHETRKPVISFSPVLFGLEWVRRDLYERINARCDAMLDQGLLEEVERLEKMGFGRDVRALNTVGYAEAFAFRAGEISSVEMVRLFKQNSRRYAKRQMTWFRSDERIVWIPVGVYDLPHSTASVIRERFGG